MKKPFTLKLVAFIAWIQIGAILFLIAFTIGAAIFHPTEGFAYGFRVGALEALGYDPANFRAYEAGEIAGGYTIPLVMAVLVLVFLKMKRLWALRITATVDLIASAITASSPLFALLVLILTWTPSAYRYMRSEEESPDPVTRNAV